MPQIAQQDYLYVDVAAVDNLTADEKALLLKKVKNGTILDVVLRDAANNIAKIIAYSEADIYYYCVPEGGIIVVNLSA